MERNLRILLIEDSEEDAEVIMRLIRKDRSEPEWVRVETETQMKDALSSGLWDIVISDYHLPSFSGPAAIKILNKLGMSLPVIVVSGTVGEDTAIEALKIGATDYVLKHNLKRLPSAMERALQEFRTQREKQEMERQLVQAQKMESIGRLAGGVAHDVNNVLSAITLFAEMAIHQIQTQQYEPAQESIDGILKAQDSAASIIRQLLVFSRCRIGPVQVNDFSNILTQVRPLVTRITGENIELEIIASAHPILVSSDKTQLEQIILNLAVNARDAMSKGGKLTLSLEAKQIHSQPIDARLPMTPGKYAVLTSTDTGCGMSETILQRLFEPFFTTKDPGKGTGLGLSVIYGILRQAGGSVAVKSIPNEGTTFSIYWPVTLSSEETPSLKPNLEVPSIVGPLTILLVEDEESVRKILAVTLRKQGHSVIEAAHGEEALLFLDQEPISLLISDIVMPKMGGPELVQKAREKKPDLLVLFLSGYADNTLQDYHFDVGSTWFLEKPFTSLSLSKKVEEVLKAGHPQAPEKKVRE